MTTFITKLGKTRAGEHSRIWIEGQRLIAVDFICGAKFHKRWSVLPRQLVLELLPPTVTPNSECGTVSGKNGKPIIDIVGAKVMETFRFCSHVNVEYQLGRITITAAGEPK